MQYGYAKSPGFTKYRITKIKLKNKNTEKTIIANKKIHFKTFIFDSFAIRYILIANGRKYSGILISNVIWYPPNILASANTPVFIVW